MTISDTQHLALVARAMFDGPANGRFTKGVRDASNALRKILEEHRDDREALETALRAYLAAGPAMDSDDYDEGGECVHSDVQFVLDGDRFTIAELLGTLNPEGGRA